MNKILSNYYLSLLSTLLILGMAFNSFKSQADVVYEDELEFALDHQSLVQSNVHIAVKLVGGYDLESKYPMFDGIDATKLFEKSNIRLLLGKYSFYVDKSVEHHSKERILDEKGFEIISKNTTVDSAVKTSAKSVRFHVVKKVTPFYIGATVDYSYYTPQEYQEIPYLQQILNANAGLDPEIITVQRAYDFSKFFDESVNICTFSKLNQGTLVNCYAFSALWASTYGRLHWFTDFVAHLQSEILFSINAIRRQ